MAFSLLPFALVGRRIFPTTVYLCRPLPFPSTSLAKKIDTTACTWHRRVICRAWTRLCLACVPVSIFLARVVLLLSSILSSSAVVGHERNAQAPCLAGCVLQIFIWRHAAGPAAGTTHEGGAVANRLRRRTSDQTVLGSNPAVAAALSPWTRLFTPIVPRRSLHISFY